jgi:hypothetical protein
LKESRLLKKSVAAFGVAWLGLVSGAAMAQTCEELEANVRVEATDLSPKIIDLRTLESTIHMTELKLMSDVEMANTYGLDPELETAIRSQEQEAFRLRHDHARIADEANAINERLKERIRHYEAVCGKAARTDEILFNLGVPRPVL